MELLQALSQTTSGRKRRRKNKFLLSETEAEFLAHKEEARKLRAERITAIFRHGKECLAQAKTLRKQVGQILSTQHENDAEYELARRDASQRKEEARKLRKKGRACISRALRFTLCFWKLPEELVPARGDVPFSYQSCRQWAWFRASRIEQSKVVNEGEVVYSRIEPAKDKEYWHHQRQLIRYRDRIFLAGLVKRVDEQPHEPWRISWVTDSPSQMTEEELRYAASQFD